jgi:PAS domain S-box-containing protein
MSYRYRFIVAFVTLELFFIALIVTVNFLTIERNTDDHFNQRVETTTLLVTELLRAPMSVYDLGTLDNISENLHQITYVIIEDNQERILSTNVESQYIEQFRHAEHNKFITTEDKKFYVTHREIFNDDVRLGQIHFIFDITNNLYVIQTNKNVTFGIIVFQLMISTLLAYFIGTQLTSKLLTLRNVASQIGQNEITTVPYCHTQDEVGQLADAMNTMQLQIIDRNDKLKLFAQLFENAQEAIIITDENGVIINVNQAFTHITGYEEVEVIGSLTNILKSGKHESSFYEKMWKKILNNGIWQDEIINKKKNGEFYISLLNISTIQNEENKITNFVAIATDITQMKEKEKIMRIQSKMATMGEMLNNIAHQWRQPLSTITSAASGILIQKEIDVLDDETLTKMLQGIIKSSQYLSKTIEDFRNYFRHDKVLTTFDINHLIEHDLTIIEAILKNNHIKLILELEENMKITNFENELVQALMNIIHNSKDALADKEYKKLLFIKTKKVDNNIELLVRDNAGGIALDIIENIFEPYFTTKHKSQGTGIGLYMTHIIITEHMGGHIKVENCEFEYENSVHKGLDFYIYLPLNKE